MKSTGETLDVLHSPALSPAEGLESAAALFSAPPIEALELLKALGDIAAASISETEAFLAAASSAALPPKEAPTPAPSTAAPASAPTPSTKPAPTADDRLMEALLEYHRLRGPKLGARTIVRADASIAPSERFAPVEIPVVENVVPKTPSGPHRASRPVQTILKPKPPSR